MGLRAMDWYVQYRKDGTNYIEKYQSPEGAIKSACQFIDDGCDVYGIGTAPLTDSIAKDEIVKIYNIWLREKLPFGRI
jgi:hypothetical protein